MATKLFLSRIMKMSWAIQRSKQSSRAKSLTAAWAIIGNEDITVFYLTAKMNRNRPLPQKALNQITLFTPKNVSNEIF